MKCEAHIQQPNMLQYRSSGDPSPKCQREAVSEHGGLWLCGVHARVFQQSAVRIYCHGNSCWAWWSALQRWQCVCCGTNVRVVEESPPRAFKTWQLRLRTL